MVRRIEGEEEARRIERGRGGGKEDNGYGEGSTDLASINAPLLLLMGLSISNRSNQ